MSLIVWGAEWPFMKNYYQLTVFVLKWIKCNLLLIEVYDIADFLNFFLRTTDNFQRNSLNKIQGKKKIKI